MTQLIAIPSHKRLCVLCDIDGTIADRTHRVHHVTPPNNNWNAFFKDMHLDIPVNPVINTFHALQQHLNAVGILVSARNEKHRAVTEKWLSQHVVQYAKLYLRPDNDSRPDAALKATLLDQIIADGYHPYLVLDDRNRVVDMWRTRGLTCLQVANGDF